MKIKKSNTKIMISNFTNYEKLKNLTNNTINKKDKFLTYFFDYANTNISKINNIVITDFITHLQNNKKSVSQINLYITYLTQFYNFLIDFELLDYNPFLKIEKLKSSKKINNTIFTEQEIYSMFNASSTHTRKKNLNIMKRDRAILELLYSTGIRVNELIHLDIYDINPNEKEITILFAKNNKERILPIGNKALYHLKEYINKNRNKLIKNNKELESLFISRQGNRLSSVSVRRMIQRRKLESNILTQGSTHAFRKSFATHLLNENANIKIISKMLGHSLIETIENYTPISYNELKRIYYKCHPLK